MLRVIAYIQSDPSNPLNASSQCWLTIDGTQTPLQSAAVISGQLIKSVTFDLPIDVINTSLALSFNQTLAASVDLSFRTVTNGVESPEFLHLSTAFNDISNKSFTLGSLPIKTSLTVSEVDAIQAAYDVTQENAVFALPLSEQLILATGSDTEKQALIATLSPELQALLNPVSVTEPTPSAFIRTPEQETADKLTMEQIVFKLTNNEFVSDDDTVFYLLGGNSLMAQAAMLEVDAGRGYNGLRTIGLTRVQALRVLSVYNVTIDTAKYESEVKLQTLASNPALFPSLQTYLQSQGLTLPEVTGYLAQLRSNHAIYTAIRNWTP